jgi:hypothetical protein
MVVYALIVGGLALLFVWLPGGFLPDEDQGVLIALARPRRLDRCTHRKRADRSASISSARKGQRCRCLHGQWLQLAGRARTPAWRSSCLPWSERRVAPTLPSRSPRAPWEPLPPIAMG